MRSPRVVPFAAILASVLAATMPVAGCTADDKNATGSAAKPAASATGTPSTSPSPSAVPSPTGLDTASKQVCAEATESIQQTKDKVASAEKIGPPAGFAAVGSAYTAGASALIAIVFPAGPKVGAAVDKVSKAMVEVASGYTSQRSKPDKTALTAAIDEFNGVCSAG